MRFVVNDFEENPNRCLMISCFVYLLFLTRRVLITNDTFFNDFEDNPNRFKNIMRSEKLLRKIDDVYLIDSLGNILLSDVRDLTEEFIIPSDEDYDQVLEGKPVFIANSLDNKTTVMTKLTSLVDTYLYISRYPVMYTPKAIKNYFFPVSVFSKQLLVDNVHCINFSKVLSF